jgi:hypothetical protein
MTNPTPPILIDEAGYFDIYPSVVVARRAIEAEDVANGVYEAFDSEGRPLLLVAHGNLVSIELSHESLPNVVELERRLRQHIRRVGPARMGITDLDHAPLDLLLEAMARFEHREDRENRSSSWRGLLRRISGRATS